MNKITLALTIYCFSFSVYAGPNQVHKHSKSEADVPLVPPPYPMLYTPQQTTSEKQLSTKIQKELKEKLADYTPEENPVVTKNGIVTIQGRVSTEQDLKKILEITKKVQGVNKVNNRAFVTN